MSSRLISIGMPIYNSGESLRRALDGLLGQTHTHFELIISDNASTDGVTKAITEAYARRDSRIRLTRQPVNLGAVPNFLWVLKPAKGEYFMWAADDDFWSANYLEELALRLDEVPEAILATPQVQIATTFRNGETEQEIIHPAPDEGREAMIEAYLQNSKSCTWIYGLYRTSWIQKHASEWHNYPLMGGDVIWLWGVILQERIVGNSQATFFYTADHSARKKQTYRQTVEMCGGMFYHMCRLSWSRSPARDRWRGLVNAFRHYYRHHLYRKDLLNTSIRIAKIALLWCWIGLEMGVRTVIKRLSSTFARPGNRIAETGLTFVKAQDQMDSPQERRDAA